MENNLGLKLIIVASSIKLILYEAKGIKVTRLLEKFPLVLERHHYHHKHEKNNSHYQRKSAPRSLFAPHSLPKDLEYNEAARNLAKIIEEYLHLHSNFCYKNIIIIAEPKMLGYIRQSISDNLKKILYKEIPKNLIEQGMDVIEKNAFC